MPSIRLPPDQRMTLMLVTVEGLSYKEAAAVAGVPVGTIMSRLARARTALQQQLDAGAGVRRSAQYEKHSDEALVAYLDGELDAAEQRDVEAWLDGEPAARDRIQCAARAIRRSGARRLRRDRQTSGSRNGCWRRRAAIRPPRRGKLPAEVVVLASRRAGRPVLGRGRYIGLAAAAALFGIMIGGTGTYVGMGLLSHEAARRNKRSLPRPRRSASGLIMPPPPTSWR